MSSIEGRTDKRIEELCDNLEKYAHESIEQGRPDSPARHFHVATISRLRSIGLQAIFDDNLYFEYLYGTLATWGMDSRGAKLNGYSTFKQGICSQREQIISLSGYTLASLLEKDFEFIVKIIQEIWQIILAINISQGESQLVAGSKTLHHLLPDLVPPIDRRYTLNFFFDRTNITNAESDFCKVFINYLSILELTKDVVNKLVGANPLNSSVTKVIDNAIIAYQAKGKRLTWTS